MKFIISLSSSVSSSKPPPPHLPLPHQHPQPRRPHPAVHRQTPPSLLAHLSCTNISDQISNFLSQTKTLVTFDLSYNKLTGPLPPSISSFPNLVGITAI